MSNFGSHTLSQNTRDGFVYPHPELTKTALYS